MQPVLQQFLDHAAKTHDEKVLQGEKNPHLFPRPVYEESPTEQRSRMYVATREKLQTQAARAEAKVVAAPPDDDTVRFNALCRGEELRV